MMDDGRTAVAEKPRATRRRRSYVWLWALTAFNLVGVTLATIGAIDETSPFTFFFPQFWALYRFFLGPLLGGITIGAILISGVLRSMSAATWSDRLLRFYGGVAIASAIMFAVYFFGVVLIIKLMESTLGG